MDEKNQSKILKRKQFNQQPSSSQDEHTQTQALSQETYTVLG